LPDSANVFNDVIRPASRLTMAIEIAPPESDLTNPRVQARTPTALWRLTAWGGAAVIALTAVAITSQTETGGKRLQLAIATLSDPGRMIADLNEPPLAVAGIPPVASKTENKTETRAETERLADRLRELEADRARLTARIATLEHNLEDMTGSIKQQSEQLAAARAAISPPPALSTPATIATALPPVVPLALPTIQATVPAENAPPPAAEVKTQLVPIPPVRVAATAANAPASEPPPAKVEFGIDLGGAGTLEALRVHWVAVKANYGPLLNGLHPLAARHAKHPAGLDYRLVAGPLPNAAEAAKLCARFPVTRIGCRPARFDGVQLAGH
jgi:hypothetical protein